jgi:hypothetical protein
LSLSFDIVIWRAFAFTGRIIAALVEGFDHQQINAHENDAKDDQEKNDNPDHGFLLRAADETRFSDALVAACRF